RNHDRGGRQGKAKPRRDAAHDARLRGTQGDSDLAARRTRCELAQGDKVGVGFVVEPFAPLDELIAEITQMSDGPAERGAAKTQERQKNAWQRGRGMNRGVRLRSRRRLQGCY